MVNAAPYYVSQITLGLAMTDMKLVSNEAHIIQISTFSTLPNLRSKDHAHRAVALHPLEVDAQDLPHTTVCTSYPNAIFAYQTVGFKQIRNWALSTFETPQVRL
ncbi:MAG: hypothetical protein ACI901_001208 [Octadecabacter sp.]|jgi:hypothetical protein